MTLFESAKITATIFAIAGCVVLVGYLVFSFGMVLAQLLSPFAYFAALIGVGFVFVPLLCGQLQNDPPSRIRHHRTDSAV